MINIKIKVVGIFLILTLLSTSTSMLVYADAPGIWTKADGINEITPILTEDTPGLDDDEASELIHQVQGWAGPTFATAADALNWVYINISFVDDITNYGVTEAWTNPEQTLNQGSGDDEDLAFLLASLLKWHTTEVDTAGGDLVYAQCSSAGGFNAWVIWYDDSAFIWKILDPTSNTIYEIPFPVPDTLWLNDEYVRGLLAGYYPGTLPPVRGFDTDSFISIADGGFGDPMNNYAWSAGYFKSDLYIGTGRNSGWGVIHNIGFPPEITDIIYDDITVPAGNPGSLEFADDMRAEIWRYHNGWTRVYRSPMFELPAQPGTYVSREIGFREMITYTDKYGEEAIYAAAAGAIPPVNVILKSTDGINWERVATPLGVFGSPRAMGVHNGKLFVGAGEAGTLGGGPFIWATDDPSTTINNWVLVADFSSLGPGTNTAVASIQSCYGYLYAGVDNKETGFQVWRSNDQIPNDPSLGAWTRIIEYGGGDMHNWRASCLEVLRGRLIVGTLSLPGGPPDGDPGFLLPKGFEILAIDSDDSWEVLVGDRIPRVPPPDGPYFRPVRSFWTGGFGNPMNFYCWSMQEVHGVLYVGSFNAGVFLRYLSIEDFEEFLEITPEQQALMIAALEQIIAVLEGLGIDELYIEPYRDLLEAFQSDPIDWEAAWLAFAQFSGADLWRTEDGVRWDPITLNGFDNSENYGFRSMVYGNPLFVGSANPFGGLEVFQAPPPSPVAVGGEVYPTNKLWVLTPWLTLATTIIAGGVILLRRRVRA